MPLNLPITGPDGKKYSLIVPDDATPDFVQAKVHAAQQALELSAIPLTRGPVVGLPEGSSPAERDLASTSQLPLAFRLKLQFARQDPAELSKLLNSQGYQLEPATEGRLIARGPDGKRYALDEVMPAMAALQYGPKVAAYGALAAGPEAGIPALIGRSILSSLAGTGFEALERKAVGVGAGVNGFQTAEETGYNVLTDLLTRGMGGATRAFTGVTRGRKAYQETLGAARAENVDEVNRITKATQGVQAAANQFQLRAAEREAQQIAKENTRRDMAKELGVSLDDLAKAKTSSLAELSTSTGKLRDTLKNASKKVFDKISSDYDALLADHLATPVDASDYGNAVSSVRAWMAGKSHSPSSALEGLLDDMRNLSVGGASAKRAPVSFGIGQKAEPLKFTVGVTSGSERANLAALLAGKVERTGSQAEPVTIEKARGMVQNLKSFATSAKSPVEAKMAGQLADAVQESIADVLPENVKQSLGVLDGQWYEASNLLRGRFKRSLRATSNPAQVIDALVGGPTQKALGVERAHQVLNEVDAAEMPAVRGALVERILRSSDPMAYAKSIDDTLWKRFFKGSSVEDRTQFKKVLDGAYKLETLMRDPQYMDRLGNAAQKAMETTAGKKLGMKLEAAEAQAATDLKAIVSPERQAELAALKAAGKPSSFLRWLGHHAAFKGGLLLMGAGYGTHSTALYAVAPFLFGRAALEHGLAEPESAVSKLFIDLMKNPTGGKAPNLMARMASSLVAEYGKSVERSSDVVQGLTSEKPISLRAVE